ncbi:hypothetical protein CF65_00530 [Aggregatibacter actinomycetemcomitans HK1651]|nr:hypothetical protein CF65_00530 [Aggregatibacter actinomycetemcomitans HK1651]
MDSTDESAVIFVSNFNWLSSPYYSMRRPPIFAIMCQLFINIMRLLWPKLLQIPSFWWTVLPIYIARFMRSRH